MKILRNLLLMFAITICFSATTFAQQDKPPPKQGKPPVIPVKPDKKPPEKPKDGKKPNSTQFYLREEN